MVEYIYLLHTSKFVVSNQPIYKIGKTTQPNFNRFKGYDKGYVMLFQSSCRDCDELENQIKFLFKSRYVRRIDCGHEYFEGDQFSMIRDLCDIVQNEEVVNPSITECITQNALVLNANKNDTKNGGETSVQEIQRCIPCGLSTNNKYNYEKHLETTTHIDRKKNPKEYKFKCKDCLKTFRNKTSVVNHQRRARAPKPIIPTVPAPLKTKLPTEVDDLKGIAAEMSSKCKV